MSNHADEQFVLLDQLLHQEPRQQDDWANTPPVIEIRADPGREQRKGVPEVIFGETKETAQIITMARGLLAGSGRAIISRVSPEVIEALGAALPEYTLRTRDAARAVVIYQHGYARRRTGGRVGIISAGTSDIPVAEEAALIAEEDGCDVTCIYDVAVAGLRRLIEPRRNLLAGGVDAIVVAAALDGALPSAVAVGGPVAAVVLP